MTQKIADLEARLNLNSKNSSTPPSKDPIWKRPKSQRKRSGKKPGGQTGHKGHGLKITQQPDQTITLKPQICKQCNNTNFADTNGAIIDCRYKIDIKIQTNLTRYEQTQIVCPNCQTTNLGQYPKGITSRIQYGEGIRAMSVLLTHYAMVGYDKTQKIFEDVFNIALSRGTIVNHVCEFAQKGEMVLNEIPAMLKDASVLNSDETGVGVEGDMVWLHTASNSLATYVTVHPKRGRVGIRPPRYL
ncbi:MAG: DUF6444 domain-containing protein [Candidatus Bathyarchaeota archaeon]|nr:DUF6444 domain-containing protein [Candidatus Termitimicrobium sp.]MCL2686844.1 DUF6444 domain-containing protein [Candidatus Termitimicrobium sp.]